MFCRHSVKVYDFFIAKFLICGFVKVKNRMMSKRGESGPRDREYLLFTFTQVSISRQRGKYVAVATCSPKVQPFPS